MKILFVLTFSLSLPHPQLSHLLSLFVSQNHYLSFPGDHICDYSGLDNKLSVRS